MKEWFIPGKVVAFIKGNRQTKTMERMEKERRIAAIHNRINGQLEIELSRIKLYFQKYTLQVIQEELK